MTINEKEVKKLADLAQLEMSEAEVKKFAEQLDEIVAYVGQLQEVDTTGVRPEGAVEALRKQRRDEAQNADGQRIVDGVPTTEGGAVKSPRILT